MADYREVFRRIAEGDYDDAPAEEREEAVRKLIQVCSAAAAAVTVQPIPFLDTALISPIQIGMVQGVARIYGHRLDKKSVLEMLSTFGASMVAQNVMMAAAKFVPFLGSLVAISMAYALTWAIGEVSDHYFKNGRGVPASELQEMFKKVYQDKRREKESKHKGNSTLKDKLEQLKQAFDAGLLDEEEFRQKKEDLLADF